MITVIIFNLVPMRKFNHIKIFNKISLFDKLSDHIRYCNIVRLRTLVIQELIHSINNYYM